MPIPTKMSDSTIHSASFRDPDGFLFERGGTLYRQINTSGASSFSSLMDSGLYERLLKARQIIPHLETDAQPLDPSSAWKVIQPERVPFISYPYEWSFSMLKDAALTTLSIQRKALEVGLTLKDASAYNIQFVQGKPLLIDTLSFDPYVEGRPWDAYRQFCQHFLAPLALMARVDIRLGQLLRAYLDGIPLDLAAGLLSPGLWLNGGLAMHIGLHARAQKTYSDPAKAAAKPAAARPMKKDGLLALIDSLRGTVKKLEWKPAGTEWGDYYDRTNYSDKAFEHKRQVIAGWIEQIQPARVWDLGANNGQFSRIASQAGHFTASFDIDPAAVEQNYRQMKQAKEPNLLPLLQDLTNPSAGIGWANRERDSLAQRGPADLLMALALIHHLAITNNTPLPQISAYFRELGSSLIIEFVPKSDSQVQRMLSSREDIFPNYTLEGFEAAFSRHWEVVERVPVAESDRVLFWLKAK